VGSCVLVHQHTHAHDATVFLHDARNDIMFMNRFGDRTPGPGEPQRVHHRHGLARISVGAGPSNMLDQGDDFNVDLKITPHGHANI
jgi:hypothetical protein